MLLTFLILKIHPNYLSNSLITKCFTFPILLTPFDFTLLPMVRRDTRWGTVVSNRGAIIPTSTSPLAWVEAITQWSKLDKKKSLPIRYIQCWHLLSENI